MQQLQIKTNHFAERRTAQLTVQQQIQDILGWGELYYCNYKYSTGLRFLREVYKDEAGTIYLLERSRIFWNWWKNAWTIRDEDFLRECTEDRIATNERRPFYRYLHCPVALSAELTPPEVVINAAVREGFEQQFDTKQGLTGADLAPKKVKKGFLGL